MSGNTAPKDQGTMFEAPSCVDLPLTEVPIRRWPDETDASAEGREFLKIITEVDPLTIDNTYAPYMIEAWLLEMGYEWTGCSWVVDEDQGDE